MPELPEVETTKTSLAPLLGQTLHQIQVFQPKLRWQMPDDLAALIGYQLQNVERRAKYLILTFAQASLTKKLIVHLGMSGSLQQYQHSFDKRKHDHLIMTFIDDNGAPSQLHYHDPRRFGAVLWHADYSDKLFNHLGPEPLSDQFDADYLYHLIQRSDADVNSAHTATSVKTHTDKNSTKNNNPIKKSKKRPITKPIKSVIMEQQVVVGVGNIYAAECLYLSGIHPATPAHELSYEQIVTLTNHIKAILKKAITLGGSTLRDFTVASGATGYFQQTLNVYGRQGEPCPNCESVLDNIKIGGRASVFCPTCQRL